MLSLVIPTYNSRKTIRNCINSILQLHHIDYEVILVDDGSFDGTSRINDIYSKKYTFITSLHQSHGGVSNARNLGISHASGTWISFIDSDDTINATNLEDIYKLYANCNNGLIVSNINIHGEHVGIHNIDDKKFNARGFLLNNYPVTNLMVMDNSGKIYNLDIIHKYKLLYIPHLNYGEDFTFTMRFLMSMHMNIIQTKISYYNYNININSSVMNYDKHRFRNELIILKILLKLYNHFRLPADALVWIKLRMAYSILLNDLYCSRDDLVTLLSMDKKNIYKYELIPQGKINYRSIKCHILKLLIEQPSIHLLFIALKLIVIKRNLANLYRMKFKKLC